MADAYKTLYQGQLPNSVAALVTVSGGKSWIVKSIEFVNVTAASVSFQIFRNGTTSAFQTESGTIPANGLAQWDGQIGMAAGEYFAGVASSATAINVLISGDEVS